MRQTKEGRLRRPMIKISVALTASAMVSAGAVALFGSSSGVVTMPFVEAAAINTSNTTVGFADSDLYGMTPEDIDRTLDEMQAMGVQNVRILIPWAGVEPAQDFYYWDTVDYLVNAAYERNMGILAVLNSTPSWAVEEGQPAIAGAPTASVEEYAEFAGLVAERYAGKVSAYEIWNEPNTYLYWAPRPDAAAYTELLQAAYPAIKEADPNATVVGGVLISISNYEDLGINPVNYLQRMYDAGAQGYFDALSFHPYQYTLPFSQGRPYGDLSPINQMDLMHEIMVANGDGDKLIWSSEYGEPTSVVDEATQAAFIQDYLNSWSQIPYAGPSFIYTTRDRDSDSTVVDDTFGVLRDDWTPKQSAYVIQQWTATHPQTAPSTVTLTAATTDTTDTATTTTAPTTTVAPTAETTTAPTATETSRAPTRTATAPTETSSTTSTGTTSTGTTSGSTSAGTGSTAGSTSGSGSNDSPAAARP